MINTAKLHSRTIEGVTQIGESITEVRFVYPYKPHSFAVGEEIIWYYKGISYQFTVKAIAYKAKGIFLLTELGEVLNVMDCLNRKSFDEKPAYLQNSIL